MARKKKTAKKAVKKAKRAVKKPVRKAAARKAAPKKAKAKKTAKTKAKNREFGEGNYKASQRFRKEEESFIKRNRKKIPALGKAAEAALEGPEGDDLRAADAATAARGKGMES